MKALMIAKTRLNVLKTKEKQKEKRESNKQPNHFQKEPSAQVVDSKDGKVSMITSLTSTMLNSKVVDWIDISDDTDSKMPVKQQIPNLVKTDLYEISRSSLDLLRPSKGTNPESWLNDEIINAYIDLINQRAESRSKASDKDSYGKTQISVGETGSYYHQHSSLCFFNTYAYTKLRQLSSERDISKFDRIVKRKKIDRISDYSEIFFPINIEKQHWLLLVIELDTNTFSFYDSMKTQAEFHQEDIISPFKEYFSYRLKNEFDSLPKDFDGPFPDMNLNKWKIEIRKCPQQINYSDCGVFLCINMNWLEAGKKLTYNTFEGDSLPTGPNSKADKEQSQRKRKAILEAL